MCWIRRWLSKDLEALLRHVDLRVGLPEISHRAVQRNYDLLSLVIDTYRLEIGVLHMHGDLVLCVEELGSLQEFVTALHTEVRHNDSNAGLI